MGRLMRLAVETWTHPERLMKDAAKIKSALEANTGGVLFDAVRRCFEQTRRLVQTHGIERLHHRAPRVSAKEEISRR